METLHKCETYKDVSYLTKGNTYADTIEICEEYSDGTLWYYSDGYQQQVNKCPVCGYETKTKI